MSTTPDIPRNAEPEPIDDAFEEIGRRAGAALRRPAPDNGLAAITHQARRGRLVKAGVAAAVGVTVVVGAITITRGDEPNTLTPVNTIPDTTTPPTSPTVAPTT